MELHGVQLIKQSLLDELLGRAKQSRRLRTNHNFHHTMEENPHRFLNVMLRGTYIAPHRHLDPAKSESFLVLSGEIAFFTFDHTGRVLSADVLGRDPLGIDIQPGVWHTITVLTEHAVCFEVKPGPYSAANDKDFAPWAPREGDPEVAEYQAFLLKHVEKRT